MATPARPAGGAAGFAVRTGGFAVWGGGVAVCTGGFAVVAGGFAVWAVGFAVCAIAPDERARTKLNSSNFCMLDYLSRRARTRTANVQLCTANSTEREPTRLPAKRCREASPKPWRRRDGEAENLEVLNGYNRRGRQGYPGLRRLLARAEPVEGRKGLRQTLGT
jgi:hypothetical protein